MKSYRPHLPIIRAMKLLLLAALFFRQPRAQAQPSLVPSEVTSLSVEQKVEADFRRTCWVFFQSGPTLTSDERLIRDTLIYGTYLSAGVRHPPVGGEVEMPTTETLEKTVLNIIATVPNGKYGGKVPCMAISLIPGQAENRTSTRLRVQWFPYPFSDSDENVKRIRLEDDPRGLECPNLCQDSILGWSIRPPSSGGIYPDDGDIVIPRGAKPDWSLTGNINLLVRARRDLVKSRLLQLGDRTMMAGGQDISLPRTTSNVQPPMDSPQQPPAVMAPRVPDTAKSAGPSAGASGASSAALLSDSPAKSSPIAPVPIGYKFSVGSLWAGGILFTLAGSVLWGLNAVDGIGNRGYVRNGLAPAAFTANILAIPMFIVAIPATVFYVREKKLNGKL